MTWRKLAVLALLGGLLVTGFQALGKGAEPLKLIQTIEIPDVPTYPYAGDIAVDLKGHRLFAAMQGAKTVVVVDINTGKMTQNIPVEYAHTVMYMPEFDQLYVTDQGKAEPGLRIFDGRDYHLIKFVTLRPRADAADYDPQSKYFYVDNGGAAAKEDHSFVSIVDTTKAEVVGDIQIPAKTLEQLVLDPSKRRFYVNLRDMDQVAVADTDKRTFIETWTITKGHSPAAIALDVKNHRLFVACRSTDMHGHVVVFDTKTGKELEALPIGGHVDTLTFDAATGRLYAACATGEIDVYQQRDADHYTLLGKAETGIMSRSGLLVPELHRYFASVPCIGTQSAKILVFQTQ
jgi:DNA-binding beta-propeller fold protein YncE